MTLLDLLSLTAWDGWHNGGRDQAYVRRDDGFIVGLYDGWHQVFYRAAGCVSVK